MASRQDDFVKQVNDLWKQAVDQLEDVKEVITARVEGRLESDMHRLKLERDRLLLRLGEQTYKLANQGRLPMPTIVKRTIDRLNEVIDGMLESERRAKGKKAGKKATKKKTSSKKAKVTKKTTAKAPAARKATKKKSSAKRTKTSDKTSTNG